MKLVRSVAAIAAGAAILAGSLFTPVAVADDVTVKLWARADRSGPLRAGNIVKAAELLNKKFKAAGIDRSITIEVHENNSHWICRVITFEAGKVIEPPPMFPMSM